jgi:hypothetical protein
VYNIEDREEENHLPANIPFRSEYDNCFRIVATAVLAIVHSPNINCNQTYPLSEKEPPMLRFSMPPRRFYHLILPPGLRLHFGSRELPFNLVMFLHLFLPPQSYFYCNSPTQCHSFSTKYSIFSLLKHNLLT